MTTFEPGAREVLTHGLRWSPRARARFATRPAPTITSGLDVLVQEVMAAMTTWPSLRVMLSPSYSTTTSSWAASPVIAGPPSSSMETIVEARAPALLAKVSVSPARHSSFIAVRAIRSWGRFGPAKDGSTVDMSSSRFCE